MKVTSLSSARAELLLAEAAAMNPGFGWVEHSRVVGEAAARIAAATNHLDEEQARTFGLLHDIGRRAGTTHNRHMIDGHHYLLALGQEDAARIALTHSFPVRDITYCVGRWDTTAEEYRYIDEYLAAVTYDDYDRLLQLCDALALPDGFCLLEKRMVDVVMRHGINDTTVARWEALFELKRYFDAQTGDSIYNILPGIVETTFGIKTPSALNERQL